MLKMKRETGLIIVPHPITGTFSDFEYQRLDLHVFTK